MCVVFCIHWLIVGLELLSHKKRKSKMNKLCACSSSCFQDPWVGDGVGTTAFLSQVHSFKLGFTKVAVKHHCQWYCLQMKMSALWKVPGSLKCPLNLISIGNISKIQFSSQTRSMGKGSSSMNAKEFQKSYGQVYYFAFLKNF